MTPGQEFVCFRCRVGWSGPNTRLGRRNVQTESQSRSSLLEGIIRSISHPSSEDKSTHGALVRKLSSKNVKFRRVSFIRTVRNVANGVASEEDQVGIFLVDEIFHAIAFGRFEIEDI